MRIDEYKNMQEIKRIKSIYHNMKSRCYNPNTPKYKYYGGKGVKICNEWSGVDGFFNFYIWSINNGYKGNLTIDRIDFNGNYEPNNCRWADSYIQNNNTISNIYVKYNGKTKSIGMLALENNIPTRLVRQRYRNGWNIEEALIK